MGDHRLCDEIQWRQGSKVRLLVGVAWDTLPQGEVETAVVLWWMQCRLRRA
jgi:hypothetical protein